jgi:hypothetical protein
MPKNNLISQFFILNFAILTNFALEKIGQCETIHLAHATWSPNESDHAVDQVIWATHRRPHILRSDESKLRQWNFMHDGVCGGGSRALTNLIWGKETSCMMEYVEGKAQCPLGKPRGIGLYESKGPRKRLWKDETLHAEWHQPTTRKLCFNIEQWKTTSCLPSKPYVGFFLDFVITS